MNVAQGTEHLEAILRLTHEAVAADTALEPERAIGPTECTDAANVGQGTFFSTLGFNFEPARVAPEDAAVLLEQIAAHWQAQGYEVDRHRLDEPNPQLLGKADGFTFRALAVAARGLVNLAGDTPCLPSAED